MPDALPRLDTQTEFLTERGGRGEELGRLREPPLSRLHAGDPGQGIGQEAAVAVIVGQGDTLQVRLQGAIILTTQMSDITEDAQGIAKGPGIA